nr:sulfotransferase [Motilibacter deserti]
MRRSRRVRAGITRALTTPDPAQRLVTSPVFVLSSVRSGSTLLRVLLNSHSQVCAPHELHLKHVTAGVADRQHAVLAMKQLGLDDEELTHLLWDRIMDRELRRTGKRVFVDKTPGNGAMWERLSTAWPQARFVFLLRHPATITQSLVKARPDLPQDRHERQVLAYAEQVEAARAALPGHVVRYEDLCADPERVTRDLCRFLGVRWEAGMLEYGSHKHGRFATGLGDWSDNIRSGRVQPPRPLPPIDEVPPRLRELTKVWGYA